VFTLHVTVRKPRVEIRVNGTLVVDWIEPPGPLPEGAPKMNASAAARSPCSATTRRARSSTATAVKPLPSPPAVAAPMPLVDARYAQILASAATTSRSWTCTPISRAASRSTKPSLSPGTGMFLASPSTAARASPSRRTPAPSSS